jgi:hypothetical protein
MLTAVVVVMCMVPPVSKDALVHHLAVPKLYLNHGGIYEIPFMDFSYYPMNLNLLYMIPLYFGNDIIPKLIHFSFALLTAWLIFNYLKKRAGFVYGMSGALFFLSIPVIVKLSTTVYVDLGVIFFSFTSLLLVMKWLREGFKARYLVYSGIMCGLALGTKYNSLVTFALLSLFIPFTYSRYSINRKAILSRSILSCVIFVFTALAVFSPWMIRNYCWKENPIYPLYNKVFHPPVSVAPVNKNAQKMTRQNRGLFTFRHFAYGESGLEISMLPLRIFFQGEDGNPRYFDGKLNPFLLIFSLLAFLPVKNVPELLRREKLIMLSFSILFILIALFSAVFRIRYIAPIIPPLTVLSILGIKNLFDIFNGMTSRFNKSAGGACVVLLFLFCLVLNVSYIIKLFGKVDPLSYISGRISRDEYISNFIPEYPALKFINENLASDSKIFFIYLGRRGYYCDRDYYFNSGLLHRIILKARNPEEILSGFQKRGITYFLVSFPLFDKWVKDNCSVEKQGQVQAFFRNYTASAFYKNGVGLHTLKTKDLSS